MSMRLVPQICVVESLHYLMFYCDTGYPQTQQWTGAQQGYPAMYPGLYLCTIYVYDNHFKNVSVKTLF